MKRQSLHCSSIHTNFAFKTKCVECLKSVFSTNDSEKLTHINFRISPHLKHFKHLFIFFILSQAFECLRHLPGVTYLGCENWLSAYNSCIIAAESICKREKKK